MIKKNVKKFGGFKKIHYICIVKLKHNKNMKKIFQNIIDRLHLIYVAFTKKHFMCAYYNSVYPDVKGGGFVEQFSPDKEESEAFIEAIYESSKEILNEK